MFNSETLPDEPGTVLSENEARTVELGIAFRRMRCYRCDLVQIYKIKVKEIRRKDPPLPEPSRTEPSDSETPSVDTAPDLSDAWLEVPRYAEIPETARCNRCGEILGLYPTCIY